MSKLKYLFMNCCIPMCGRSSRKLNLGRKLVYVEITFYLNKSFDLNCYKIAYVISIRYIIKSFLNLLLLILITLITTIFRIKTVILKRSNVHVNCQCLFTCSHLSTSIVNLCLHLSIDQIILPSGTEQINIFLQM